MKIKLTNYNFLLSILFILFTGISCTSSPDRKSEEPVQEPEVVDSLKQLSILFAGDVMGHGRQIRAAFDEATETYDYRDNYKYVAPIIQSADLAVANLEVTLPGKPPYTGYPLFKSPDALAYALKDAGFNTILTANNHSNDSYGSGLINTLDVLGSLNLYHTGTFRDINERDSLYPLIIEKNDFKVAMLNYTFSTNGIPDTPPTFVNRIDTAMIREDIAKAKLSEPDIIIAYMHWGAEYQLTENRRQREQAQFLADAGADLIIGAHPHVVQPVRYIHKNNGDSILCAYSLGNYISNQIREDTDGGMMFEINYEKNIFTGEVEMIDYSHQLVYRHRTYRNDEFPHGQFFIIPIAEYEAGLIEDLEMPASEDQKLRNVTNVMRTSLKENESVSKEKEVVHPPL